jgi:hypothetical protein
VKIQRFSLMNLQILNFSAKNEWFFPLISLKDRDSNRGIHDIGFKYYDADCSDLSSFLPDIFVMQPTDPG